MKTVWTVTATGIAVLALCSVAINLKRPPNVNANLEASDTANDPVAKCKALAPDDPYENAANNDAYNACKLASGAAPKDVETQFRFGLAAIQVDRLDEGVAKLKEAAGGGHCQANYFLGDRAWHGDKDVKAAEEYYDRAAECGDSRAKLQVFGNDLFEKSAYPAYMKALYNSDVAALNNAEARFVTASYVAGFYEALSEQFLGPDFNPCWVSIYYRGGDVAFNLQGAEKGDAPNVAEGWVYEKSLPVIYQVLFPAQGSGALEDRRHALRKAGNADLIRMAKNSECGALGPHKLITGVTKFAESKKSLRETAQERLPNVNSLDDLVAIVKGKAGKSF